ncbi:cupin domain-containing protein [Pseudoalteromonas rubra]|uniref:cupin domain-containing protein n=1 Tax=Pseudoalteromonas rubra TaxID=43658 RepID=UPI000698E8F8|nr:cupin domain-containing protein [Pseudoalteromonas rubra]
MKITDVFEYLDAHPEGSFLRLADFNGYSFGTCNIKGVSPGWEMHPDTDEFFFVIEGYLEILLLQDTPKSYRANAGSAFVVPKGIWHKPGAPDGAKFIHFTPGQSLYSERDDPRVEVDT